MRKYLLLLLSAIVFSPALLAQHEHTGWCKTDEVYKEAYNQNPDLFKQIERQLDEAVVAYDNSANKVDDGRTFYIPIVFHYVHPENQSNFSAFFGETQAQAVLERLNDDFNRNNSDTALIQPFYTARRGNARIKFLLAQVDPDGEATTGINYYSSDKSYGANRTTDDEIKYLTYTTGKFWAPDKYLNFWVVTDFTREGLLAYATLPEFEASGNTRASQSGVIGRLDIYRTNTSGAAQRHALSHEVGHWLGLRHPFQEDEKAIIVSDTTYVDRNITRTDTIGYKTDSTVTADTVIYFETPITKDTIIVVSVIDNIEVYPSGCNTGDCKFSGDKICDIPQVFGQFLPCARNSNSCPNEPEIDNYTNIMDYRSCTVMFSKDQVTRMRGTLVSLRTDIVSWENLQRVGISDKIVSEMKGKATVYPNPFNDRIIIEIELQKDVTACIEIRDLLGRSAYKDCKKKLHEGINKIEINANEMNLTNQGVYFVEVKMENAILTNKIQYTPNK